MKLVFSLLIICFVFPDLLGQSSTFAPMGARWYYRPYELMPKENTLYAFTVTKDTVLDGVLAKELSCTQWINGQFQDFPNLNKYVYSGSDSVWYYVDNQWELLFNFGAQPGDTIASKVAYFDIFNGCIGPDSGQVWNFAYRIDSVAIEQIGGWPLRVQYVSSICPVSGDSCWLIQKIVERIGVIDASYWWGQGGVCILGGFPGYLRCYADDLVQYKGSIGNTPCDYVSINEISDYNFAIFPNPTTGILNFSFLPLFSNLGYTVLDGLGHNIVEGRLMAGDTFFELNLESAPPGIFYIKFMFENQIKTFKVVKM